jgi:hypothetical protein
MLSAPKFSRFWPLSFTNGLIGVIGNAYPAIFIQQWQGVLPFSLPLDPFLLEPGRGRGNSECCGLHLSMHVSMHVRASHKVQKGVWESSVCEVLSLL